MTRIACTALIAASLAIGLGAYGQAKRPQFTPPGVVFAGDINYPINSVASGLVSLLVSLNGTAHVKDAQVVRPVPSLNSPTLLSIGDWKFSPATLDGSPEESRLAVNVVFNPGDFQPHPIPLPAAEPQAPSTAKMEFVPPQVVSAWYAAYPAKAYVPGSVVLDLTLDESGKVRQVSVIRGAEPFTESTVEAVHKWNFRPGTFDGKPIDSKTVVAFVFRSPSITTPPVGP